MPGASRQRTLICTDAEADAICAWAGSQDISRWQVGAVILTTFRYTDLRLNELFTARLDDLDLDANRLSVVGKGDKRRVVPVPPVLSPVLADYVEHLRPTPRSSPNLFVNPRGHQ